MEDKSAKGISKKLSTCWHGLSQDAKEVFESKAEQLKAQYHAEKHRMEGGDKGEKKRGRRERRGGIHEFAGSFKRNYWQLVNADLKKAFKSMECEVWWQNV